MADFPITIFKGLYVHSTCKIGHRLDPPIMEDHGDVAKCSKCGWTIPTEYFIMACRKLNNQLLKSNPDLRKFLGQLTNWKET
jgi:hypothetical protein